MTSTFPPASLLETSPKAAEEAGVLGRLGRRHRVRQFVARDQLRADVAQELLSAADALTPDAVQRLGWCVYAINQEAAELSLAQAVVAYREENLIEHSLGRLKGRPLSLAPMYVERDDHATGLVRLLTIALRVQSLVKFVVRCQLAQTGERIAGLYAGNPQRATDRPSTEQILGAFQEITLTVLVEPQQTRRHVTALSALHHRLLALLELPSDIYTRLGRDSAEPP